VQDEPFFNNNSPEKKHNSIITGFLPNPAAESSQDFAN